MREQLTNRNFICAREIGNELRDFIVERKFSLFLKQEDRGRGELLADRADAVTHLRRGRSFRSQTRVAVSFRIDKLAVPHDCDRSAGYAGSSERVRGELVDLLLKIGRECLRARGNDCES